MNEIKVNVMGGACSTHGRVETWV